MTTKYYLFGDEACKVYHYDTSEETTQVDNVIDWGLEYDVYRFGDKGDDDPSDLLNAFNGWGDYAEITEEEYNQFIEDLRAKGNL
jgi:hypothetical protein